MKTHLRCPVCSHPSDSAITTTGKKTKPHQSDLIVCGLCASMLYYSNKKQLVLLPDTDFYLLPQENQQQLNDLVYKIVNKHK